MLVFTVTSCVSVFDFAYLVSIPIGIKRSPVELNFFCNSSNN